jgi:hypothetical protein
MNTQDRLEFAIVLAQEIGWGKSFPEPTAKLAMTLIRYGRRMHKLAEDACNFADESTDVKIHKLSQKVNDLLAPYGIQAKHGGDPRGCVLQLILPRTRVTNGWGGEGYCVPR